MPSRKPQRITMPGLKLEAIKEHNTIIETITHIKSSHAGCTGYLDQLEDIATELLLKFITEH